MSCGKCGGPLPAPAGPERGVAPPPPPRRLPEAYRRAVMLNRNVHAIVGLVFLIVGGVTAIVLVGIVFLVLGFFLWRHGRDKGRSKLAALEHGVAAEGSIREVVHLTHTRINGRSPWRIEYVYRDEGGKERSGGAETFDRDAAAHGPHDPVWIVYVPGPEEQSSLWPPVA